MSARRVVAQHLMPPPSPPKLTITPVHTVIHSPTLTASKWWIGSLGRSATHAVVMARLVLKGKNLGPHPFVVPLRDVKTREMLPGITVGDIGPKQGYQSTDNGAY